MGHDVKCSHIYWTVYTTVHLYASIGHDSVLDRIDSPWTIFIVMKWTECDCILRVMTPLSSSLEAPSILIF